MQVPTSRSEFINALVQRPALYFGTRSGYIREIVGFEVGTVYAALPFASSEPAIPSLFIEFICSRVPIGHSKSPSWNSRIEDSTNTEKEAWDLFVLLWKEYYKPEQKEA